jgi:hypothetical protein
MSVTDTVTRLNTALARENAGPTLGTVRIRSRLACALLWNDVWPKHQNYSSIFQPAYHHWRIDPGLEQGIKENHVRRSSRQRPIRNSKEDRLLAPHMPKTGCYSVEGRLPELVAVPQCGPRTVPLHAVMPIISCTRSPAARTAST